ncbi:MAG: MbcA/ParS/Xre antitoxin family protein [Gammaproteobacteria bacterium]|nr:MbcA/ParS/Xre antitoxin family protein [Gammaproteobacteria bacterium]MCW8988125.1 MbcA/ParS/Xre antitoxin family protein [Gammaproteobacteria bacterium]MCW9030516.1 MbcA/ParS/Xre antitoxin family protein [Gammaproteobacteria bacterium]
MRRNSSSEILYKAFLNAGDIFALTSSELSQIINCDISQIDKIIPDSTEGVRATYFIRIYKKLFELLTGDKKEMKLWMEGYNTGTGGIPLQQIQERDVIGLKRVMEYVEAIS